MPMEKLYIQTETNLFFFLSTDGVLFNDVTRLSTGMKTLSAQWIDEEKTSIYVVRGCSRDEERMKEEWLLTVTA